MKVYVINNEDDYVRVAETLGKAKEIFDELTSGNSDFSWKEALHCQWFPLGNIQGSRHYNIQEVSVE